jgi:hypothetical protein
VNPLFEMRDPRRDEPVATAPAGSLDTIQQLRRFPRDAQGAHSVAGPDCEDLSCNGRVEVKMMVGVDVVERQAGRLERRELCLDLGRKLPPDPGTKEDIPPHPEHVGAQPSLLIDKVRYAVRRHKRPTVDENEMKPDPQRRQAARARHGIFERPTTHHQACRG